jgi:hypothetical protein
MCKRNDTKGLLEVMEVFDFKMETVYDNYKIQVEPPLHYAARKGDLKLLKAILSKIAEPCEEGEVGHLINSRFNKCTALEVALRACHYECAEALEAAHAEC